mgnify:CR=1 FL=1
MGFLARLRHAGGIAQGHFLGKVEVGVGALGLDVVMDDGLAVAGRFGKAHVARDDRLEDKRVVETTISRMGL